MELWVLSFLEELWLQRCSIMVFAFSERFLNSLILSLFFLDSKSLQESDWIVSWMIWSLAGVII